MCFFQFLFVICLLVTHISFHMFQLRNWCLEHTFCHWRKYIRVVYHSGTSCCSTGRICCTFWSICCRSTMFSTIEFFYPRTSFAFLRCKFVSVKQPFTNFLITNDCGCPFIFLRSMTELVNLKKQASKQKNKSKINGKTYVFS